MTTAVAGLFACSVGGWMFIPVAFTPGFSSRIRNAIRQT
ncbi:putative membrane protein [Escherichia coli 1-110-08_S1_C1]|nr:putative membrane protein [Escherichia coli 1-110-08_S1_C1]